MDQAPPLALVVEDETVIRMETVDLLAQAGFSVLEAWSVATALRRLDAHRSIRLLVTDVQMPGESDGFGLAREVSRLWPDIMILVISGVAAPGPGDLPDGARFIGKPFSARAVIDAIEGLASRGEGLASPGYARPR